MHQLRNTPQTLAYEPLDSQHTLACPRIDVRKAVARGYLRHKMKWIDQLEQNQQIRHCCRNPLDNADIEAWYSCDTDKKLGVPDIYKFYCRVCEANEIPACHVKFCVGGHHPLSANYTPQERPDLFELRPFWEVR